MEDILNINEIKEYLRKFAKERDWEKFHSPKNICMAIGGEIGELNEIFQWLTEEESIKLRDNSKKLELISQEICDILLYTIRLSDILNINIKKSIENKIAINENKYPIEKVKGSSKKYTEY